MEGEVNKIVPFASPKPIRRSLLTMSQEEIERIKLLSEMLATSSLAIASNGKNKLAKGDIFLIILKGLELGFEPMAALDSINLIQGKPTLSPAGMLALIYGRDAMEDMKIVDETDDKCTITMTRRGQSAYTRSITREEMAKWITTEWAGDGKKTIPLTEKHNWKQMPRIMLKWRLVSTMCRTIFNDIIQNVYTPEELGADVLVDEDGNMTVLSTFVEDTPPPVPTEGWATAARVIEVLKFIRKEIGEVSDAEIARLGDLKEGINDLASWNKFESGKQAKDTIIDRWKFEQTPAQPQKAWDTTPIIDLILNSFDIKIEQPLEDLGKAAWSDFPSEAEARKALFTIAAQKKYPLLTEKAAYHKQYTSFQTAFSGKEVRFYGGRTALSETLPPAYIAEWGITDWKEGETYEIGTLRIADWEVKSSYIKVNKLEVVSDEEMTGDELAAWFDEQVEKHEAEH